MLPIAKDERLFTIVPAAPGCDRTLTTLCTGRDVSSEISSFAGSISRVPVQAKITKYSHSKFAVFPGDFSKPLVIHFRLLR